MADASFLETPKEQPIKRLMHGVRLSRGGAGFGYGIKRLRHGVRQQKNWITRLFFTMPWSRTSHILWQGLVFDSCGARLWLGAPGHVRVRERSRLRCPNVDHIRRRFRSSSPGCRCSGTIRGVGGQHVFLPSVPSALRPLFAWCSVEMNQPHPNGRALFCSMRSPPMAWSTRPYTCKGKIPVTMPKC